MILSATLLAFGCIIIHGAQAVAATGLIHFANPKVYAAAGFWLWNKRNHWLMNPSQYKLSFLNGLIGGSASADQEIRRRIQNGYLDNEAALYTVERFQDLVIYLIQHNYLDSEEVVKKCLFYSNYKLMNNVLKKFPLKNLLNMVIYVHKHMLWNIMDNLLAYMSHNNADLELLLSNSSYDGLSTYLIKIGKIKPDFDTLQLAAKLGNLYVVKNIVEKVSTQKPNYQTLVLAAESGNIQLVRYLCENHLIEPEVNVLSSASSHDIVKYLIDILGVPLYDGCLHAVCEKGLVESVKYILEDGRLVPNFDIVTVSAKSGNVKLLKYLIEDKGFKESSAALEVAASNGRLELFKYLLIDRKVEISPEILISACHSGTLEMLKYLIEGLDYLPNSKSLQAIIESGSFEGFIYWINLPNTNFSVNSLNSACIGGDVTILNYLIETFDLKPDVSCLNEALKRGHGDIFLYFLKMYDSMFLQVNSATVLGAIEGQNTDIVKCLLPHINQKYDEDNPIAIICTNLVDGSFRRIISEFDEISKDGNIEKDDKSGNSEKDDESLYTQSSISTEFDSNMKNPNIEDASLKIIDDYTNHGHSSWFKRILKRRRSHLLLKKPLIIDRLKSLADDEITTDDSGQDTLQKGDFVNIDNSIMIERNPIKIDDKALRMAFTKGNPEIVDYLCHFNHNYLQFQDIPYLLGNMDLVKYLIDRKNIEPKHYHLKLAAASGNVELLKYLVLEQKLCPHPDSFDFAAICGKLNIILYTIGKKYFQVDNLLLYLANQSQNQGLIKFLSTYEPQILGTVEYFSRRAAAVSFRHSRISESL